MTEKKNSKIVWKPMPNRIVVKKVGERETFDKAGLIFRPVTHAQPRTTGEVLAVYEPFVDEQDKEVGSYLQVGDIVIFGKHGGIEIEYGSEVVICLAEREILTKVEFEDPSDVEQLELAPGFADDIEG